MGLKVHSWRVDSLKLDWQQEKAQALTKQKAALDASCEADKHITQEVSSEYQKKLADLSHRVRDARRMLSQCQSRVYVQGFTPARYDAAPGSGKPAGSSPERAAMAAGSAAAGGEGQNPWLPAGSFIDLMAEGDKYRIQLLSCQEFTLKTQPASLQPPK